MVLNAQVRRYAVVNVGYLVSGKQTSFVADVDLGSVEDGYVGCLVDMEQVSTSPVILLGKDEERRYIFTKMVSAEQDVLKGLILKAEPDKRKKKR